MLNGELAGANTAPGFRSSAFSCRPLTLETLPDAGIFGAETYLGFGTLVWLLPDTAQSRLKLPEAMMLNDWFHDRRRRAGRTAGVLTAVHWLRVLFVPFVSHFCWRRDWRPTIFQHLPRLATTYF